MFRGSGVGNHRAFTILQGQSLLPCMQRRSSTTAHIITHPRRELLRRVDLLGLSIGPSYHYVPILRRHTSSPLNSTIRLALRVGDHDLPTHTFLKSGDVCYSPPTLRLLNGICSSEMAKVHFRVFDYGLPSYNVLRLMGRVHIIGNMTCCLLIACTVLYTSYRTGLLAYFTLLVCPPLELDLGDNLIERFALDICNLNLERGRRTRSIGTSEGSSAPRRS